MVGFREDEQAAQDEQAAKAQAYDQQQYALSRRMSSSAPPSRHQLDDMLTQLQKLGELKAAGVLTEEEFAAQMCEYSCRLTRGRGREPVSRDFSAAGMGLRFPRLLPSGALPDRRRSILDRIERLVESYPDDLLDVVPILAR